jgi:hypothetical protein
MTVVATLKQAIAPAQSAVSYEKRTIDLSVHSTFRQEPGPDADAAWNQLLRCKWQYVHIR